MKVMALTIMINTAATSGPRRTGYRWKNQAVGNVPMKTPALYAKRSQDVSDAMLVSPMSARR
jgi:hypothetical protein